MTFEVKILAVSHPLLTSEVIVRLCGAGHLPATAIRPVARLRRIGLHTAQMSQCSCVTHKPRSTAARNGISIAADKPQDHISARRRPTGFDEAYLPLRREHGNRQVQLRMAAPFTPFLQ
jgi:hypothetical protein